MKTQQEIIEHILILRAQHGHADALERLIDRYHGRLLYYVRKWVGNDEQAKDILQIVWLDVFQTIGTLRSADAFSVWLYRIARNKAVQHIRRDSQLVTLDPRQLEEAVDEPEPELDESNARNINRGLERLNPLHRDVLVLRFLEEMSYEEIADVVGCSVGTVRSRIHYAKKSLKTLLEEMNHEPE